MKKTIFFLFVLIFLLFQPNIASVEAAKCGVTDKGIKSSPYGGKWGIHQELQKKANELLNLAKKEGLKIQITEGFRSKEYQDSLYAKGRSCPGQVVTKAKGGQSMHNYGLAFDIKFDYGYDEDRDSNNKGGNDWQEIGKIGQSIGLEWGGAWKSFVDKPHFQYTWELSLSDLQSGKLPPDGMAIDSSKPAPSSEKTEGFVGDILDISAYFKKGDVEIKNVGIDKRETKPSKQHSYTISTIGSKFSFFLFRLAQFFSIFLIGYILLLWLVYFLAFSGMEMFIGFLSKITFNKIDIGDANGIKKLGIFTLFSLLVIVVVLFGLLPKIFGFIYHLISLFFEFIGRVSFYFKS